MDMKFDKYKNDGWGLSELQLKELLNIIKESKNEKLRVVEFGSGKSTEFLVDIVLNGIKPMEIISFDDNPTYAYKNDGNHEFINLKITGLEECDDESYNKMFNTKTYDKSLMSVKTTLLHSRQKNNFYKIEESDLTDIYDLMILDSPNGNGRNISYLHMQNHLDIGSIVLIDDYTHYDFIEKFELFFDFKVLHENNSGKLDQWLNGGIYKILEITNKK
jgi:hypothetical protein